MNSLTNKRQEMPFTADANPENVIEMQKTNPDEITPESAVGQDAAFEDETNVESLIDAQKKTHEPEVTTESTAARQDAASGDETAVESVIEAQETTPENEATPETATIDIKPQKTASWSDILSASAEERALETVIEAQETDEDEITPETDIALQEAADWDDILTANAEESVLEAQKATQTGRSGKLPFTFSLIAIALVVTTIAIHRLYSNADETPSAPEPVAVKTPDATAPPQLVVAPPLRTSSRQSKAAAKKTGHEEIPKILAQGMACNNTAEQYYRRSDYANALKWHQDALKNFEKAQEYFEQTLGREHDNTVSVYENIAVTYNNIGEVYRSEGQYSVALEWLQKALILRQKNLG